ELIEANYGYDKYGGNCHMVPNHGLIIHSLLHGEGDFSETMKIINTCGWDTDCNSGNVGCLMGIKEGLGGIDAGLNKGLDWRGPVADRIYIPTADGGRAISDCAAETDHIVRMGRRLAGIDGLAPKDGAQFHFSYSGSVQGFQIIEGDGELGNAAQADGEQGLRISSSEPVRVGTPVFTPSKEEARYFEKRGYALLASPRLFPGQTLTARVTGVSMAQVNVYVTCYGEDDAPVTVDSPVMRVGESGCEIEWVVPSLPGPIFQVGLLVSHSESGGSVYLDRLGWSGAPEVTFTSPKHDGSMWRRAWVNGVDTMWAYRHMPEMLRLIQNQGTGLVMQGTREWQDYTVTAAIRPHMARRTGVAARVQGMTRYYGLLFKNPGTVQLVRACHQEIVLGEVAFDWQLDVTYEFMLTVKGDLISGRIDGQVLIEARDDALDAGAVGLVIEEGRTEVMHVSVSAAK
ncbi:MAG: ADP-ribosylglycohydrolase family protein, partial [Proteobacteria bacterium]|nr:ADP-ribosylglycohydrolase family protein [Pseudomonadota bacterium]